MRFVSKLLCNIFLTPSLRPQKRTLKLRSDILLVLIQFRRISAPRKDFAMLTQVQRPHWPDAVQDPSKDLSGLKPWPWALERLENPTIIGSPRPVPMAVLIS